MHLKMTSQFLKFCVAGSIGFLIDATVLYGVIWCGSPALLARVPAFVSANTATWLINRRYTFNSAPTHRQNIFTEWKKYFLSGIAAWLLNYSGFAVLLFLLPEHALSPIIALSFGTGIAMLCNFELMKRFVFR